MKLTFRRYIIVLIAVVFLNPISLFLLMFLFDRGTTGYGVTSAEANRQLLHFSLPTSASNINYLTYRKYTHAEFAITEQDFKNWCHAEGWSLTELPSESYRVFIAELPKEERSRLPEEEIAWIVEDGLEFNHQENDGHRNYSGVYDRKKQRASVSFTLQSGR